MAAKRSVEPGNPLSVAGTMSWVDFFCVAFARGQAPGLIQCTTISPAAVRWTSE